MKEIPLTQGYVALVDDDDYERAIERKWWVDIRPTCVYAATSHRRHPGRSGRSTMMLHRFIMRLEHGQSLEVDHVDHDGLNCQKSNLRLATRAQNSAYRRRQAKRGTPYKGVYPHARSNGWSVHIGSGKALKYLGSFRTPEEGARVYDRAALEAFGEFAFTNFPRGGAHV